MSRLLCFNHISTQAREKPGKVIFTDPYADYSSGEIVMSMAMMITDPTTPDIMHVVAADVRGWSQELRALNRISYS